MIKNWNIFNESNNLPVLKYQNMYPLDEEDILDYLTELEDERWIIDIDFGFINNNHKFITEISSRYAKPGIWINIQSGRDTSGLDVTSTLTAFIKRIQIYFKSISISDDDGIIDIKNIKLTDASVLLYLEEQDSVILDSNGIYILCEWFDDIYMNDFMIFNHYNIRTKKEDNLHKKDDNIYIDIEKEDLVSFLLPGKSTYAEIISDEDYDIYQYYGSNDYLPDHYSFFEYTLDNDNIKLLLEVCFKNYDNIKKDHSDEYFITEFMDKNKDEFINYFLNSRKNYHELGKFLNKTQLENDIYNQLRLELSDWEMAAKADEDYNQIIKKFDEHVEDNFGEIITKIDKEIIKNKKNIKTNKYENYKTVSQFYQFKLNIDWITYFNDPENYYIEDIIYEYYGNLEKTDINPHFSDYADIDNKSFNSEVKNTLSRLIKSNTYLE